MSDSTRERIYHVVDLDTGEKLLRRDIMAECQYEAQKLNKKEGRRKYAAKGAWALHKNRV
jgi:hypothetical protein